MTNWIKPSEINKEGQYLLAARGSMYLQVVYLNQCYINPNDFWEMGEFCHTLTEKYDDEEYRLLGPMNAPIW